MARSKETPNTAAPETDDVQQSLELLDRVLLEFEDPNSGPSSRIHDPAEDTAPSEGLSGGPTTAEPPPPEEAARLISALMPRGSPRSSPGQSLRRSPHDPGGSLAMSPSQATAGTQTTLPKATRHHGSKKLSSRFGSLPFDLSSHAAPQNPPAWLQVLEKRAQAQRDCVPGTSSNGVCAVGDRNHLHLPLQNPLTTSLNQEPNSGSSCSDVEEEEQFSDDSLDCQVSSSDREADLRDMGSTTSHENIAETEESTGTEVEGRQRGSVAWDIPLDWDLDLAACEESASKKRRKDNPPGGVSRSQPQTPSCPPPVLPTSVSSGGGTYVIRERKKRPALEDAFSYCPVIPTSATYTCGLSHVSQYKPQHKNKAKMSKGKSLPSLLTYKTPSCLSVPETKPQVEETSQLQCNNSQETKSKQESDEGDAPVINNNDKENAINNAKINNVQEMSFKIMRPKKIRPHSMPPSEGDIVVFKSTVQLESSNVNDKHNKMRPISMPFNENEEGKMYSAAIICNDTTVNGSDLCNTGNNATESVKSEKHGEPEPDYSDTEDAQDVNAKCNKLRPQSVCVTKCSPVEIKPRPTSCSIMLVSDVLSETKVETANSDTEDAQQMLESNKIRPQSVCISKCSPIEIKQRPTSCAFIPLTDEASVEMSNNVSNSDPEDAQHFPQANKLRPKSVCVPRSSPTSVKQRPSSCIDVGKFNCELDVEKKIDMLLAQSPMLESVVPQVRTAMFNGEVEDNKTIVAQNNDIIVENKPVLTQNIILKDKDIKTEIILLQNTSELFNGIDAKNDVVIEQITKDDDIKKEDKIEVVSSETKAISEEVKQDYALVNGESTEAVLTLSTDIPSVEPQLPYSQDVVPSDLPPPPNEEELEEKFGTVSSLVQTDISVLESKKHKLCLDSPGEEQVVPSLSYRTNVLLTPDDPPHNLTILGNIPLDDKVTVQCSNHMLEPEKKFECQMDDDDSITITTVIIESKDDEKKDDFLPIKRPADLFSSKLESKLSRDSTRRKSHGSTLEMTTRAQENRRSAPECSFLFPQGHYTIPLSFAVTNKPPSRNQEIHERPPVPLPETPTPKPLGPLEPTYKSVRKEKKSNGVAKRHPQPPPLPPHQNLSPPEDEYAEPRKIPDFPSTARKHNKPVRPKNLVKDDKAPPLPPHQGDMFEAEKPLPPTPLTPVQNTKLSILEDFDSHPLPPSPPSPKPPRPLPTSATFPVPPSPASMHRSSPHGGRRRHTPPSPLLPRPPSPRSRPHPLPPSPCDDIDAGSSRPRRPLPSPPESDYGFTTREAGGTGLGSLKTRSVDAGLGRGLREQLQTSISQAREVGSDRRTLPTELSGATPRRHAGQQYNTGLRTGKKKGRAPTVPPHASLPETPVFTRGCDIPRAPYRPPAVGIPVLRSSLSEEGDRLVLCGPARGWYPKQRQNKSARSTENLDQASSMWGEPRKPQTLPPNLNPPKFFHRSPREALRRVTSLLIRRAGNTTTKEPRSSKDVVSPNGASGSQCETPQRQKRSFFRNFWKKSKHYSLEQ